MTLIYIYINFLSRIRQTIYLTVSKYIKSNQIQYIWKEEEMATKRVLLPCILGGKLSGHKGIERQIDQTVHRCSKGISWSYFTKVQIKSRRTAHLRVHEVEDRFSFDSTGAVGNLGKDRIKKSVKFNFQSHCCVKK